MKIKKLISLGLASAMALSLAGCGGSSDEKKETSNSSSESASVQYSDITLGVDNTDLTATIKLITNRTDMLSNSSIGKTWAEYLEDFNKDYPNITVQVEGITNYADDAMVRLTGGDWGDVMMIPSVDAEDLEDYFLPFGSLYSISSQINYLDVKTQYNGTVYGIPAMVNGAGVAYNKRIFEEAGIETLPTIPSEFIADLQLISDNTEAIPLYTNYASGWTMGVWDDYIGVSGTGNSKYTYQVLPHTTNPFSDPGDGTSAYNVYKILYDAVSKGLTEDDFSTTDWESSKTMLNNGEIGCMVIGGWAYSQICNAGAHSEDVGYMPFPITVDGKMYALAKCDYNYGINKDSSEENQLASMIFVKWMTEKSGYNYDNGGIPLLKSDTKYPEMYDSFIENGVTFIAEEAAFSGEEELLDTLNASSILNITNNGNQKIQSIVENAKSGNKSFDEIMNDWNSKWSAAQTTNGVETN